MYYFSQQFLDGLQTKSEGFQGAFYNIINEVCGYLENEDEKKHFQQQIEKMHSYDKPGNILHSTTRIMGGKYTQERFEEVKEKIHMYLFGLFDDYSAGDVMVEVSHIIVCISAPQGCFEETDMRFIQNLLSFERVCRGASPVDVTVIVDDITDGRSGINCFVAMMK